MFLELSTKRQCTLPFLWASTLEPTPPLQTYKAPLPLPEIYLLSTLAMLNIGSHLVSFPITPLPALQNLIWSRPTVAYYVLLFQQAPVALAFDVVCYGHCCVWLFQLYILIKFLSSWPIVSSNSPFGENSNTTTALSWHNFNILTAFLS